MGQLHVKKLASKFIPPILSSSQKATWVKWCQSMLSTFNNGHSPQDSISGDETWIHQQDAHSVNQCWVWCWGSAVFMDGKADGGYVFLESWPSGDCLSSIIIQLPHSGTLMSVWVLTSLPGIYYTQMLNFITCTSTMTMLTYMLLLKLVTSSP